MHKKSTDEIAAEFWRLLDRADPALADLLHPDITLRPSGKSQWSGTYAGVDAVVTYLIEVTTAFPEQRADLVDTMTGRTRIAYLIDLHIERDGRSVDDRSTWLLGIRDGLVIDWELNDSDQYAMDDFWSAFPEKASV